MKQMIAACLGLALMGFVSVAQAEIVQGYLELRWGDPLSIQGKPEPPPRFVATLVTDGGLRHTLDPAQARRAAVDLYALASRRVAVEFSRSKRGGARLIEAIVPADRPWLPASSKALVAPKAVLGNTRWVTIACKFKGIAEEQKPVSFFQGQYGTAPGQLGHYWQEVSYGKINLAGSSAHGWFNLPQPRSYYVDTDAGGYSYADLNRLFNDCAAAADPRVDFSSVQGVNLMFNGNLDGFAWGGDSCGLLDGVEKCLRSTWIPAGVFEHLATLAHEMGHGYGLPHSNNSDGDNVTYDNPWDLMSGFGHNAVVDATYGPLPKHLNIIQRDRLGWVDAARKLILSKTQVATDVLLDRASLGATGNLQMIQLEEESLGTPGITHPKFTLEVRKRSGKYEAQLAGDAVIIHEVYPGSAYSLDADNPPADLSNNEGSMFKVGEYWLSRDRQYMVRVKAETASGFIVSIARPRFTGGPQSPRIKSSRVPAAPEPPIHRTGSDCIGSASARCSPPVLQAGPR